MLPPIPVLVLPTAIRSSHRHRQRLIRTERRRLPPLFYRSIPMPSGTPTTESGSTESGRGTVTRRLSLARPGRASSSARWPPPRPTAVSPPPRAAVGRRRRPRIGSSAGRPPTRASSTAIGGTVPASSSFPMAPSFGDSGRPGGRASSRRRGGEVTTPRAAGASIGAAASITTSTVTRAAGTSIITTTSHRPRAQSRSSSPPRGKSTTPTATGTAAKLRFCPPLRPAATPVTTG
mmetsp:Transcript_26901/g.77566  ORF Transcript_26901/g.77566 Transcript_26901/m.77566 type:complete len:234 (-) Transcript_26901:949-1650(-)